VPGGPPLRSEPCNSSWGRPEPCPARLSHPGTPAAALVLPCAGSPGAGLAPGVSFFVFPCRLRVPAGSPKSPPPPWPLRRPGKTKKGNPLHQTSTLTKTGLVAFCFVLHCATCSGWRAARKQPHKGEPGPPPGCRENSNLSQNGTTSKPGRPKTAALTGGRGRPGERRRACARRTQGAQ